MINFKSGDKIVVRPSSYRYNGALRGRVGVVRHVYGDQVSLMFDNLRNDNSSTGAFYLGLDEIIPYKEVTFENTSQSSTVTKSSTSVLPEIKNVIFNDPATIVLWGDGTKTVVKCQDDDFYSEEIGLALCIAKKALGNKGNFNNVFKKWIPEDKNDNPDTEFENNVKLFQKIALDLLSKYRTF